MNSEPGNEKSVNGPVNGEDYLWDGSGQPDPEVQRLEGMLVKFRSDRPAPALQAILPHRRWAFFSRRTLWFPAMAAAAGIAVAAWIAFSIHGQRPTPEVATGWDVSSLAGTPRIGHNAISGNQDRLSVGQVLETDDRSRATLETADTGQIEIDPDTRLRLVASNSGLERIALDHGTIHTHIWAPPGRFVVDTPSAVTVDLGCAYTLKVEDSGAGVVRTSLGWVGFKLNGHESFIPAGAACRTRPVVGPGTPYFEDAPPELLAALARFDFEDTTEQQKAQDLATVLAQARNRDALTLWHLLSRVDSDERDRVYQHLRHFVSPPPGVTREGILRLDQPMLDVWWNALGFDDISIWRRWENSWSATTAPGHDTSTQEHAGRQP